MREADPGGIPVAEGHHIRISVRYMPQVALAETAADIVKQAENIRLVGIQARVQRDFLRAVGRCAAVVSPGTGVERFGFSQDPLRFGTAGISFAGMRRRGNVLFHADEFLSAVPFGHEQDDYTGKDDEREIVRDGSFPIRYSAAIMGISENKRGDIIGRRGRTGS
jgi:hypothetical protein